LRTSTVGKPASAFFPGSYQAVRELLRCYSIPRMARGLDRAIDRIRARDGETGVDVRCNPRSEQHVFTKCVVHREFFHRPPDCEGLGNDLLIAIPCDNS
jgi:hypothetical protein